MCGSGQETSPLQAGAGLYTYTTNTYFIKKLTGDTQLIISNIMVRVRDRSRCRFCLELRFRIKLKGRDLSHAT